jgi:hypothetical protein
VGECYALLRECIIEGGSEALEAVQLLAASPYGDETYALERKAPSAFALCCWGMQGLDALVAMTAPSANTTTVSLSLSVLASVAAGADAARLAYVAADPVVLEAVRAAMKRSTVFRDAAYARLTAILLDCNSDAEAISAVARKLQMPEDEETAAAARELLCTALAARRLAVGSGSLRALRSMIESSPLDHRIYQKFFLARPRMLEPSSMTIWRAPKLVARRKADYVIRRTDGSYLVVKVETPGTPLITTGSELALAAGFSIRQALQYVDMLKERSDLAREHFPDFQEPDGLVVAGLEGPLSREQRAALAEANRSFFPGLRLVGFDWLLERGTSVARNVTEHIVSRRSQPTNDDGGG